MYLENIWQSWCKPSNNRVKLGVTPVMKDGRGTEDGGKWKIGQCSGRLLETIICNWGFNLKYPVMLGMAKI